MPSLRVTFSLTQRGVLVDEYAALSLRTSLLVQGAIPCLFKFDLML